MESYSMKDEKCPQLELRLGPPGEQEWTAKDNNTTSFGCNYSNKASSTSWQNKANGHFLRLQQQPEKKVSANTAVLNTNTSQKRNASGPVVGWPPVRSFRKNLASGNSSKSQQVVPNQKPVENCTKGLFVKINMDGVPIGRKVDLKACDSSYVKFSFFVDQLFKGLLAAQNGEEEVVIGGLMDGSGEYTLVYEDNEGDRMLVGDVPWHMFISTVKRLRVLKSSELPTLSRVSIQGKASLALD